MMTGKKITVKQISNPNRTILKPSNAKIFLGDKFFRYQEYTEATVCDDDLGMDKEVIHDWVYYTLKSDFVSVGLVYSNEYEQYQVLLYGNVDTYAFSYKNHSDAMIMLNDLKNWLLDE
jgi:hypothetical protein